MEEYDGGRDVSDRDFYGSLCKSRYHEVIYSTSWLKKGDRGNADITAASVSFLCDVPGTYCILDYDIRFKRKKEERVISIWLKSSPHKYPWMPQKGIIR